MELYATITPNNIEWDCRDIMKRLKETFSEDNEFVVCKEKGGVKKHIHFHAYMKIKAYAEFEYDAAFREKLRRILKKTFVKDTIYLSKRTVEDKIKTIAYTLKDGDWLVHRVNWQEFLMAQKISHPKDLGWNARIKNFFENEELITNDEMIDEIIEIHKELNIPIYEEKVARLVRTKKLKNNDKTYMKDFKDRVEALL